MLAPIVIKRKLFIGNIRKSEQKFGTFWYIPIHVKANRMWNLLVSSIEDVKAIVTFINDKGIHCQYQATWVNPDIDDPLIKLCIESERDVRLATISGGELKPINEIMDDALTGNQDIQLELKSGDSTLGQWLFQKAIVEGSIMEVGATKIR